MPKTSFIIVVDHDDEFNPMDLHALIAETIEDDAMGGSEYTSAMNSVETITATDCGECSLPFDPAVMVDVMLLDNDHADQPMEVIPVCPGCFDGKVHQDGWGYSNAYADPDDYEVTGEDKDGRPVYKLKGE